MTEPDALLAPAATSPDDPRRLGLADLVGRLTAGLAALARDYEAAAALAPAAFQQALRDLARAKASQLAVLAPVGRALGVPLGPTPAPVPAPGGHPGWGVILGQAFQAERTMEWVSRELAVLTEDPAIRALAALLTGQVAQDREEVRKLYLRYS